MNTGKQSLINFSVCDCEGRIQIFVYVVEQRARLQHTFWCRTELLHDKPGEPRTHYHSTFTLTQTLNWSDSFLSVRLQVVQISAFCPSWEVFMEEQWVCFRQLCDYDSSLLVFDWTHIGASKCILTPSVRFSFSLKPKLFKTFFLAVICREWQLKQKFKQICEYIQYRKTWNISVPAQFRLTWIRRSLLSINPQSLWVQVRTLAGSLQNLQSCP